MVKALFGLIYLALVIVAVLDILKNIKENSKKMLWIVVSIFVPYVGPILYFVLEKKK